MALGLPLSMALTYKVAASSFLLAPCLRPSGFPGTQTCHPQLPLMLKQKQFLKATWWVHKNFFFSLSFRVNG